MMSMKSLTLSVLSLSVLCSGGPAMAQWFEPPLDTTAFENTYVPPVRALVNKALVRKLEVTSAGQITTTFADSDASNPKIGVLTAKLGTSRAEALMFQILLQAQVSKLLVDVVVVGGRVQSVSLGE